MGHSFIEAVAVGDRERAEVIRRRALEIKENFQLKSGVREIINDD